MATDIEIKHKKDGTPYVSLYLGTSAVTGKRIRRYRQFRGATDEEARELAQDWANGLAEAAHLHVSQRLDEVLSRYIDTVEVRGMSPNTVKTYRSMVRCYIEPTIGAMDPSELRPHVVEELYDELMTSGGRTGRPVSASKVIDLHWFLRGAYKWIVKHGISPTSPMEAVTKPEKPLREASAFTESELARLNRALGEAIAAPAADRDAIFRRNAAFAAYLALWNGERCGEVCANSVADAQLARGVMHIAHTAVETAGRVVRKPKPKGKRSRNVALYADVREAIREHYRWQEEYLPERLVRSTGRTICTDADGKIMRPSMVSRAFSEMRDRIGLPRETSFHSLRHTHATWLLLEGVDLKTIAARLGHAKESITLEYYSHLMPGRDQMAADVFATTVDKIGGFN